MRLLKLLVLNFFFITSLTAAVLETDVLLITNDMGDMNDLKAVADTLTEAGIPHKIAALGTSAEKLEHDPRYVDLSALCALSVSLKGKLDPNLSLSDDDMRKIRSTIKAKVCLMATSHKILADLSRALPSSTKVIAYYDNLDSMETAAFVQPFVKAEKRVDLYLLPSQKTLDTSLKTGLFKDNVRIIGKPSLDGSLKAARDFTDEQARKVFKELNLDPKTAPVILFAGGRDDTYKTFFPIFIQGVKDLDVRVWLTYHPATDASFEKEVLTAMGAKNVTLVPKMESLGLTNPTAQLLPYVKGMACVQTSADLMAAKMGVPLLYVNAKDYTPTLLEVGQRASTPEEVSEKLQDLLTSPRKDDLESGSVGLPNNGAKKIVEVLRPLLGSR